jgi:NADH:flavin oxidoreductase / NADH oxidase family
MVHTARGKKAFVVPRELSVSEIHSVVSDFASSARRARAAGADTDYPTFIVAPTVINVTVTGRNRFIVRAVYWFEVQKRRKGTL